MLQAIEQKRIIVIFDDRINALPLASLQGLRYICLWVSRKASRQSLFL